MKERLFPACAGLLLLISGSFAAAEIVIEQKSRSADGAGIVVPPPATAAKETNRSDAIEFLNGDRLHGTFLSYDNKAGLRWQHPAMKQVITINPEAIYRVKLDRPRATNSYAKQVSAVRLTNDDELVGELVSLDEENLHLDTWYAGTISIPRQRIGSISPGQGHSPAIYEGPAGIEGWTVRSSGGLRRGVEPGSEAWRFVNESFISVGNGSLGRQFQLPGMLSVDFDLTRRGYLQLAVCLYTDNLENYGGNSYMLQMSHSSVYLQRMSREGNSSSLGQTQVPVFAQKSKMHISIRANRDQRSISLLVDGALVKQWADSGDFPNGNGIIFLQQGQGTVKISDLRISEWDGRFEDPGVAPAKTREDLVRLANNDKISGTLKSIKDGKMAFATAFATLDVPVERISQIDLATEKSERAEPQPGSVRAIFAQRGSLTFDLDRWDDQQVMASSPNFGKKRFLPSAFDLIQFNLDRARAEGDAGEFDGAEGDVILFE